jgi:DHA1 family multidrug resistance protein-like MFS transporter
LLRYLPTAYYSHAGSVLAANDLFRSTLASVFPLFGHAFYSNLGIGPGSTLLAGLSALMVPLFWLIKKYGATLRQRSKYAH